MVRSLDFKNIYWIPVALRINRAIMHQVATLNRSLCCSADIYLEGSSGKKSALPAAPAGKMLSLLLHPLLHWVATGKDH